MAKGNAHSGDVPAATAGTLRRVKIAAAILMLILVALAGRIAQIQFDNPGQYTRLAAVRRMRSESATRRGDIYDREGRLLATSVPHWSVFADPTEVYDPFETARILARVLNADLNTINARLRRSDRRFVWIKRQVSPSRAEWVRALELKGVYLRREDKRFHPFGSLFAHVVGFTDIDGRGLEGVEARFEKELGGFERLSAEDGKRADRGYDIYLTLDAYIQSLTRDALLRQVERHRPEAAWALALDARSGEVLSMVNWPQYDPGAPAGSPERNRRNSILADTYEYGSVLKPITVAIALESGIVEPDTEFDCHRGAWRFGRRTIRDVSEHGNLTVRDIVARSSNIGVAQIGLKLGVEDFWRGLNRFGFGDPSGIELQGESTGIMRAASRWNDHSLISIAFGQEISINAMALARAFAALGNDGVLVQPRVLQKITDPLSGDEIRSEGRPENLQRAVSKDVADEVMRMLARVVEEGTGTRAAVEGYRVGGKTGTGTLMCKDNRGYSKDRYISTFVGLAPIDDPGVVILVSLKVPTGGDYYGGIVAGPAFSEIAQGTLGYLKVPPDIQKDFLARTWINDYGSHIH